ncbi:hypothetical protein ANN_07813 [Periplaneta americana]|uniref:Uncharacterized protein n=1 Tax=Periplaneta americana TaxID=6978 RepID=A0ABQ8T174_PERAM|nr:hypothetical protein ANN_07813 [Periplaneta americana]
MGFCKVRSTFHAVTNLMADIKNAMQHSEGKLYALFHGLKPMDTNGHCVPILNYGIQITREPLKKRDMALREGVKTTFLKRTLAVSRYIPSQLV